MHTTTSTLLLALGALASAQSPPFPEAPVASGNPIGASYRAVLPDSAKNSVRGSVVGVTGPGGVGTEFTVEFRGVPAPVGGDFIYHIHEKPVPADGNCTATLAHLDPLKRGEDPPCQSSAPATCQVGDLAGKHGKVPGPGIYAVKYLDRYVSGVPGAPGFYGDKSIVFHYANKTRITCANFQLVAGNSTGAGPTASGGAGGSGGSGGSGSGPTATPTYSMPQPSSTIATGAASVAGMSLAAVLLAAAAML